MALIYIVEDDTNIREIESFALKNSGYQVNDFPNAKGFYDALKEKGYDPVNQIVGYILSEDPTYITTHQGARNKIRKLDRDDILQCVLKYYLA